MEPGDAHAARPGGVCRVPLRARRRQLREHSSGGLPLLATTARRYCVCCALHGCHCTSRLTAKNIAPHPSCSLTSLASRALLFAAQYTVRDARLTPRDMLFGVSLANTKPVTDGVLRVLHCEPPKGAKGAKGAKGPWLVTWRRRYDADPPVDVCIKKQE